MADRLNFYFRQRVTEAELDLAFEQLEVADRHLASDLGIHGIVSGARPAPHEPVADLTIKLEAPARAYDQLGQRVFFGVDQRVDCSTDVNGLLTEVMQGGKARWLGIYLRFDRRTSEPRTDGNSQEVFFRRDESFELRVRMAPEADVGVAPRAPLVESELLVCDVLRRHGQTQIVDTDIDLSRRQAFIFATGSAVEAQIGLWKVLKPAAATVQASFDEVDAELDDHFSGRARRHQAEDIVFTPSGDLRSIDVQAALPELVALLASESTPSPGSRRVGARELPGSPHALASGRVDDHLARLLDWLNTHLSKPARAHHASAIEATPHHFLQSKSVQGQLQELLDELKSLNPGLGSAQIGSGAINDTGRSLARGSVRRQLTELLSFINIHAVGGDHDGRYYLEGSKVTDSGKLEGLDVDEFARSGHHHDDRYLRKIFQDSHFMDPGEQQAFTILSEPPQLVTVAYNHVGADRLPEASTFVLGAHTSGLSCWVTKIDQGGGVKDHQITVRNSSTLQLYVSVVAYGVD